MEGDRKVDPKLVKADAEVIDLQGKYVRPGFVNTHVHTAQLISRGVGDDVDFICWLHERMWPFESSMTEDGVYVSTLMTSLELIRSGVTSFVEPGGQFVSGMARATAQSGLRGKLAKSVMDCGDSLHDIWQRTMKQGLEQQVLNLEKYHNTLEECGSFVYLLYFMQLSVIFYYFRLFAAQINGISIRVKGAFLS